MPCDTIISYTWNQLETDVELIIQRTKEDRFVPQLVVGLIRGGCTPAVMLSHRLKVPMECLHWSKRDFANQSFGHFMDGILKKALHENMKVLIVEDIVDSGATVGELQSYASKIASKKYWSSYMKFASLWQNTSCNVQADYWINSIDREVDQRWVVMPWEA